MISCVGPRPQTLGLYSIYCNDVDQIFIADSNERSGQTHLQDLVVLLQQSVLAGLLQTGQMDSKFAVDN